jgi:hypothetical protein
LKSDWIGGEIGVVFESHPFLPKPGQGENEPVKTQSKRFQNRIDGEQKDKDEARQ